MRFLHYCVFFTFFLHGIAGKAQDSTLLQPELPRQSNLSPADSLLQIAHSFIGTPYRLGGHGKSGFDCSGFVHYLYDKFQVPLAYSCTGIASSCDKIQKSELQKGDLIFFKGRNIRSKALGHVSIVWSVDSSGIRMIHATRRGVVLDRLSNSAYYKARILFYARPKEALRFVSEE